MKTIQEIKNEAWSALKGRWAEAIVATILLMLVDYMIDIPILFELFNGFRISDAADVLYQIIIAIYFLVLIALLLPLLCGYLNSYVDLHEGVEGSLVRNMTRNTRSNFFHFLYGMIVQLIATSLWSILLILPGIIKSYSYAMTPYILRDYPDLTAVEALKLSERMMKGHKMELFRLQLSFLGWLALTILSVGILLPWTMPYIASAYAVFYIDVRDGLTE